MNMVKKRPVPITAVNLQDIPVALRIEALGDFVTVSMTATTRFFTLVTMKKPFRGVPLFRMSCAQCERGIHLDFTALWDENVLYIQCSNQETYELSYKAGRILATIATDIDEKGDML